MKLFLIVILFVYSVNAEKHYISDNLEPLTDRIVNAINALNTTWKAGKNFNGTVQIDTLVHTQEVYFSYDRDFPTRSYGSVKLPVNFDAREAWPNCTSIGKIYDQTKGYPSWIYTAVGTVADRLCIKTGVQIDVEATVEHMIKSNVGSNNFNNSANIGRAFNYWAKNGIFTVESVKESSCLPFSSKCQSNEIKPDKYFKVTNEGFEYESEMMISVMSYGPISAYIQVDPDFLSYKSGVYKRLSEKHLGYQNIKIIGWGTENGVDYLLATNSWGTGWGEEGLFKLQRFARQLGFVPEPVATSLVPVDNEKDIPRSYVYGRNFYLVK